MSSVAMVAVAKATVKVWIAFGVVSFGAWCFWRPAR